MPWFFEIPMSMSGSSNDVKVTFAYTFVKFLRGPYTALNSNEGYKYPTFKACYDGNVAYPSLYAKKLFDKGLKATDMYKGKTMLAHLLSTLETCRYILEDVREIDAMLSVCMDKAEFEKILATFVDISEEDDEDFIDFMEVFPVRGYLIWYARKHGYDTSVVDKALEGCDPVSWEDADMSDVHTAGLSNLAYWIENAEEAYDSSYSLGKYDNGYFEERDIFEKDDVYTTENVEEPYDDECFEERYVFEKGEDDNGSDEESEEEEEDESDEESEEESDEESEEEEEEEDESEEESEEEEEDESDEEVNMFKTMQDTLVRLATIAAEHGHGKTLRARDVLCAVRMIGELTNAQHIASQVIVRGNSLKFEHFEKNDGYLVHVWKRSVEKNVRSISETIRVGSDTCIFLEGVLDSLRDLYIVDGMRAIHDDILPDPALDAFFSALSK